MGSKGGGATGPTNTTVTNSSLPTYAEPFFTSLMQRGEAESKRPYQTYGQDRIADQSPDTLGSYGMVRDLSTSGLGSLNSALNIYGGVADNAGGIAGYQPQNVDAGRWSGQEADRYMNPYLERVLNVQKDMAVLDYQRAQGARNDAAIRAGAFGDSRHGVVDALANEALTRQMAQIDATGRNQAWNQAQSMWTADQGANLQAGISNQGADLQARQLGLEGLQTQLGAGQALAAGQGQFDAQTLARANALSTSGDKQAAYQQGLLDIGYNDFVNQRDAPRQNLQFLSSLLHGIPISANQNTTEYQTINPISQMLGLGLGSLGLSQMNR